MMKFLSTSLLLLSSCFLAMTLAQRSQGNGPNQLQAGQDYIDIPVRAGYRIMGDDSEGYLEDGIIVKTKGTGYIAPRYRQKYYPSVYSDVVDSKNDRYGESPMQQSTPIRQRRFDHHYHHHYNHKQFEPSVSASAYAPRYYRQSASSLPKKYLKSEIIYGRREW
ncbi:uncharacterized protein LOC113790503 [Dermatophagoides pteronyssinus]|uniref:uncharacterized protein LOC113790503 n=1 Tax=Dermatophagoides pteronyssinus TaxID=6956 RepID=UPI003F663441